MKGVLFERFIARRLKKKTALGAIDFPTATQEDAEGLNATFGDSEFKGMLGIEATYNKTNAAKKRLGKAVAVYGEEFAKGGKATREYGGINLTGSGSSVVAKYGDGPATGEVNAVPSASNPSLFTVASSSATKGYGPRLYDAVMEKVTQLGGQLTSDRSRVSRDAERVWKYYLTKRPDVQKTPLSTKDWYSGPLFDQEKFASEDPKTWPPHSDESWALLTGYSKSPSLIKDSKKVKQFAKGGPAGTDTVPALLTPGEFVINKQSAEAFGYNGLEKINKYAKGGPVGVQKFAEGGGVNFGGVFFALSIGLSTLTNLLEGVSGEFKAISDSLLSFGVATAAAFKVLSTLTSVNLPRFIGNNVKGLADKTKDSLSGGDEVETKKQSSSIKAASGSNDKYLITINRTLLSLLKETQIISVRAGQSASRYSASDASAREDRIGRTSQSSSILRKIRRSGPGAGDVPEAVAPKTSIFKKLGGVFSKIVTKAAILNSVMGLLAAAVGLVSAHFTLLASTAEQAKEKAIKEGEQETAVRKAGEESRAKADKKAALSMAAAGAAIGTFAGPIGTLVGAATGLAAGLLLGSKGMDSLILVMGQFVKGLVGTLKALPGIGLLDIDWDGIEGAVDSFTVNLLSSTSEFKNKLDGLSKATQAASENITKSLGEKFDVEQKAFTLATTDSGREKSIQRQTEILLEHGRKFDETNGKLAEQTAKIEEERNAQLAGLGADQGQKDAVNKIANDALEKAQAQNIKLLEQESSTRLDTISKLSQQASTSGQSLQVEKDLNKGKKLTRDQDNIIRRDSLQANGELISIYNNLVAAGVSERDAMIRITQSLDGATSAAKQFSETLKNQSKAVGGIFRQLFTGPLEDSFKVAQKLNDAMDVAEGSQSISGLGRERGNAAADAFGQFMSIGAVTGEQTDEAFKGAIPESAYKGLQDALTRKITSEDPTGSPQVIAEKVQEGMRKAAEGFFGADVVQNEIKDANLRTAKAVETLATQKEGEQSATPAKPLTNVPTADSSFPDALAVRALGGMIYANEGALVNFQPKGTDTVPAMLTPGEFVIKKSSVDKYGDILPQINAGNYADGGAVKPNYFDKGGDVLTGDGLGNGRYVHQTRLDILNQTKPFIGSRVIEGVGIDDAIGYLQLSLKKDESIKEEVNKVIRQWTDSAYRYEEIKQRRKKPGQSFSDKYAGELAFVERAFRPLTEAGVAVYQGVTGAAMKGAGVIAGAAGNQELADLYSKTGGQRLNVAGQSAISAGSLGYAHEGSLQAREEYNKFLDENYTGTIGGVKISSITKGVDFVGEAAAGVIPEAGIASGISAVSKIGKGVSAGVKVAGAGAKAGAKGTKVTAAVEELAKIDKVIKADAAYLKSLKKTLKKAEKQVDFDSVRGSQVPEEMLGNIPGANRAAPKPKPKTTLADELPKLKQKIQQVESSIDSMRQTRQIKNGQLDELKRIEEGSLSTTFGGKQTDDVLGKLDDSVAKAGKTDDIAKAADDVAKAGKTDEVAKAVDAITDVAAKPKKISSFQRVGNVLKGFGRLTGGSISLLVRAAIKAAGNKDALALIDSFLSPGGDEPSASTTATAATAADAATTTAAAAAAADATAKSGAAAPPQQENIAQRLREELYKEYIAIKYPTIGARFNDEDASDKAGKDFGLGSDAATKWLYDKWRNDEVGEEGFSSQYLIQNVGDFRKEARQYRTEDVNSMSRKDKKAYLNARIYGKSQYGEGMASQGYQHTFAGTVGDAENEKRTVLENTEITDKARKMVSDVGAALPGVVDFAGGAMDKLIGLLDEKPQGFNTGGYVNGPPGRDVIPAYLSRGEFVMRSSAVNNIGRDNLTKMNSQNFQNGGSVGSPQTSTMNQEMKVEGGKELLDAGRILKDAAKTIPTTINLTVDQLPAVDANMKIDGGQIVGTIKSAVEEWVGVELDARFRDYELKQQSGGG